MLCGFANGALHRFHRRPGAPIRCRFGPSTCTAGLNSSNSTPWRVHPLSGGAPGVLAMRAINELNPLSTTTSSSAARNDHI